MTVLFIPQAQYRLDDAIFWLKGWAAANVDQSASADALRLVSGLCEVRDYLSRLADQDVTFLTEHAIVVNLLHVEAVLDGIGSDGRLAKGVDRPHLAAGTDGLRSSAKRHTDASRQIRFHQMHRHRPWALPGDDQTLPF